MAAMKRALIAFMEESGKNVTPDKLPKNEREPLLQLCDEALRRTVEYFEPRLVVGVGAFAEARAKQALSGVDVAIGRILHPSPASPAANRDWAGKASEQLEACGVKLPAMQ